MSNNKDWTGDKNSIFKTIGASNHTDKERQNEDFYATESVAIDKLAKVYHIPHFVYECACGAGHHAKRLEDLGHEVFATDLVDRGYGNEQIDFLTESEKGLIPTMLLEEDCCILTNPPFKYATEFVEKALEMLPAGQPCIMLLKTTALEGKSRFERLYRKGYLECIYQFTERLLCAKNGDFEAMRKGGGSAVAYSWFVFNSRNKKPPQIFWI